jgi:hypothetical protein
MHKKHAILTTVVFFVIVLMFAVFGEAHAGEEHIGSHEVDGFSFSLVTNPEIILEGEPVILQVHVADSDGVPVSKGKAVGEILREEQAMKLVEPGVYELTYTFERFGKNELDFTIDNTTVAFEIDVLFPESGGSVPIVAGVISALTIVGFGYLTYKKKMKLKSSVLYGVISLTVIWLGYSVVAFYSSSAVQGCVLQVGDEYVLHCHQSVHVIICGEDKNFGWEAGELNSAHTHKGSHRIHWHPGEPVADPPAFMTLRNMFEAMDLQLSENSVEDPETGTVYTVGEDTCGEVPGTLKVYTTAEKSIQKVYIEDFLDLGLEDEARIDIEFS